MVVNTRVDLTEINEMDTQNENIELGDIADDKTSDYDPVEFGNLIKKMKGERSYKEFAVDADLSESFVSKAMAGFQRTRPSRRTLMKLLQVETDESVDRDELIRTAGYNPLEFNSKGETVKKPALSASAIITNYYGEGCFTAMAELMKALAEHGVVGDMTAHYYREADYFEITDEKTGQVYVGISAFIKPQTEGGERDEINAVFSIAFSVGLTYNRILTSAGADDKIVYILTDNRSVFEGCRSILQQKRAMPTVIELTENHKNFCEEDVLSGAEFYPISLVD